MRPGRLDPLLDRPRPQGQARGPGTTPPVIAAVAAGGAIGAVVRAALQAALPHRPGDFGWVTLGVNVTGCLLIGALVVLVGQLWADRPLLRPFLGVGVLGGFTTFSAYVLDIQQSLAAGAPATALTYLTATLLGAVLAVWAGDALAAHLVTRYRRRRAHARSESPR